MKNQDYEYVGKQNEAWAKNLKDAVHEMLTGVERLDIVIRGLPVEQLAFAAELGVNNSIMDKVRQTREEWRVMFNDSADRMEVCIKNYRTYAAAVEIARGEVNAMIRLAATKGAVDMEKSILSMLALCNGIQKAKDNGTIGIILAVLAK